MGTIIITGASRGIGLATAKKFLERGWRVVGTYRANQVPIQSPNLTSVQLDLASPESIEATAQAIRETAPHIDVLVNSAGIILDATDTAADLGKIRQTFEVDLFGLIDLTERLLPHMGKGSHIINVDSAYGAMSLPIDDETSTGYRLAKVALNMYTRTLAFHLKDKNVTVSSLDPGWVKTDMGYIASTESEQPNREPSEVADDIYRLATEAVESGRFWLLGKQREW